MESISGMRILCDRHHSDLMYSLQRLFEDRFGMELYVPVGLEWWQSSIWKFGEAYGDDRLARQFLAIDGHGWREIEQGVYITFDQCHPERPLYGVTLEKAREWKWDFVLASVRDNQRGFHRFAQEKQARYLYHVGNAHQLIDWSLDPFVLDSANAVIAGTGVCIGQEFDHLSTFRFREPMRTNSVVSFMNLLAKIPESQESFSMLSKMLPEFQFKSFGHECPDGFIAPVAAIAEEMARAGWAYHDKPTGDGFGHVVMNWAAVGRPLIGHGRYYRGQRAEVLWQDGATCIDLDKHSVAETAKIIKTMSSRRHESMCRTIRTVFEHSYDPKADAYKLADALGLGFFRKN